MADDTSLQCREDILRKILQKIEDWQRLFEAKLEEKFEGSNDKMVEDRSLFVKIHLEYYLISEQVLNQVFSGFGELESIERLGHGSQFHWRIQFRNHDSAFKAFESLSGRCIYDGCCRMELFLSRISNKANDMESSIEDVSQVEEFVSVDPPRALKVFDGIPSSQVQDRTLYVKIHYMNYSISCLELDKIFSRFGDLERIEILTPESEFHSKVCFKSSNSALEAFNSVNGRNIYDDGCRMELFLMKSVDGYEIEGSTLKDSSTEFHFKNDNDAFTHLGLSKCESIEEISQGQDFFPSVIVQETQNSDITKVFDDREIESELLFEMPSGNTLVWTTPVNMTPEVELVWMNPLLASHGNDKVANSNKMYGHGYYNPERFSWEVQDEGLVFDPGILQLAGCDIMTAVSLKSTGEFKAGINTSVYVESANWKPAAAIDYVESLPFDPGGSVLWSLVNFEFFVKVVIAIELCNRGNKSFDISLKAKRLVFDPGGSCFQQWGLTIMEFDQGGRNELPLHNGRMDTFAILVFDPGGIGAYECFKEKARFRVLVFDPGISLNEAEIWWADHVFRKSFQQGRATHLFLVDVCLLMCYFCWFYACYILQTGTSIFTWQGNQSTFELQQLAVKVAEILQPGVNLKHAKEGMENSIFWAALGGKQNYAFKKESQTVNKDPHLYSFLFNKGKFQVEEIYNFTQDDLLTEDILILDTHAEVFVWVGQTVDPKEKQKAFERGEKYIALAGSLEGLPQRSHYTRLLKEMNRASSLHTSPGTQQRQLFMCCFFSLVDNLEDKVAIRGG